jgi:hypothetical protein
VETTNNPVRQVSSGPGSWRKNLLSTSVGEPEGTIGKVSVK